jgi:hypothetical protein
MFHVQKITIDRQFRRTEKVPRAFGDATNVVLAGGSVQFGLNVEVRTDGIKTTMKYAREMKEDGMVLEGRVDKMVDANRDMKIKCE